MFKKTILALTLSGMMVLSASAGTMMLKDNALTINVPSDNWKDTGDSKYWASISDGNNCITIDRLEKGKDFPALQTIVEDFSAISMDYYTTQDYNYVVKSLASFQSDLEALRKVASTVSIKEATGAKALTPCSVTYYVNSSDGLRVRTGPGQEFTDIATLPNGQAIEVQGFITSKGLKNSWARINYNNQEAYCFADFISANSVKTTATTTQQTTQQSSQQGSEQGSEQNPQTVTCDICGMVLNAGADYRNHMLAAHPVINDDDEYVTCEICGMVLKTGNDYRNHMLAAHPVVYDDDEYVTCEICGMVLKAGNDYRNHMLAAHPVVNDDYVTCEYCGASVLADEYFDHVLNIHGPETSYPYVCPYCGIGFNYEADYQTHLDMAHGQSESDAYYCDYCGGVFYDMDSYASHYCPGSELSNALNDIPDSYIY